MALTDIVNMPQLQALFTDPKKYREQIHQLGPSFSESMDVQAKPASPFGDLMGMGPATSMAPELKSSGREFNELAPTHENAGGEGVQVQDEHSGGKKRDWSTGLSGLSVMLTDVGNALGNERSPINTGGYEMARQHLQSQQMEALQRRHKMFDDAYEQVKSLPPEVFADPKFAALAQAAQGIRAAGDKGKVDDEKAVSSLLTEISRHRGDLENLTAMSQAKQQQAVQDAMMQHQAGLTDLYGPTPGAKWQYEQTQDQEKIRQFNENQKRLDRQIEEQTKSREQVAQIHADAQREAAQAAQTGRAAAGLGSLLSNTMKMYEQRDAEGNLLNADEAYKKTLATHTDDIIQAGISSGLRVHKAGTPDIPLLVINGRVLDAKEGLAYIRSQIAFGGGQ